jgi:hypothetical protein
MQRVLAKVIGWALFVMRLAEIKADGCPKNPVTSIPCSSDHYFLDSQGNMKLAGQCGAGGQCLCASDFVGSACQIPIVASAKSVLMNNWAFLAKSCWSSNAQGSMQVSIRYTPWNCSEQSYCRPLQNISSKDLPQIMFYSSYDSTFSQSLLQSYTTNAQGAGANLGSDQPCFGNTAVYKEALTCLSIGTTTVRPLPPRKTLITSDKNPSTWTRGKPRSVCMNENPRSRSQRCGCVCARLCACAGEWDFCTGVRVRQAVSSVDHGQAGHAGVCVCVCVCVYARARVLAFVCTRACM